MPTPLSKPAPQLSKITLCHDVENEVFVYCIYTKCLASFFSGGAQRVARLAVGLPYQARGAFDAEARQRFQEAEAANPRQLLQDLRQAREQYEDIIAPGRANLRTGLINRWNNALTQSEQYLEEND